MEFLRMFANNDDSFAEMAVDPERRRALIKDFSQRRTFLFCCAIVGSIGFLLIPFISGSVVAGSAFVAHDCVAFTVAALWLVCMQFGSDLRLLRVIDRLQKD